MDRFERVRAQRDEYEAALDEAEKLRAAYHREVVKLHRSGVSLREIAEQLGISHQRVHQIVGTEAPAPRRGRRVVGVAAIAVLLVAGTALGVATLHRGPEPVTAPSAALHTVLGSPAYTVCHVTASSHRNGSALSPFATCTVPGETIVAIDPNTGRILALMASTS
jgi:hypothetical protein